MTTAELVESVQAEIAADVAALKAEYVCKRCEGTGIIDTPWSGSDPVCPECGGDGVIEDE